MTMTKTDICLSGVTTLGTSGLLSQSPLFQEVLGGPKKGSGDSKAAKDTTLQGGVSNQKPQKSMVIKKQDITRRSDYPTMANKMEMVTKHSQ